MTQPGAFHTLTVSEETAFGMRLGDGSILLPRKSVPEGCAVGDALEVFVYEDAAGRPVATLETPKARPGEFALLEVVDRSAHGVFMDWGLEKDLFVPRDEQVVPMSVGQRHVVMISEDGRGRVMGSARVRDFLDEEVHEAQVGQGVEVMVYEAHELGMRVIVAGRWEGLVYNDEIYEPLRPGARLEGTIAKVRDDGKLDIHTRPRGLAAKISTDKDVLLAALRANDGQLPLYDKSSPAAIKSVLKMSKKAFKRALGGLLRTGLVCLEDGGIRLLEHAHEGEPQGRA